MQAVILAAGEGRRLRPLTEDRPKPMVLVGDRPLLEHTLETLPKGINEIILVVGYKQEKIKEYFGDEWRGTRLVYVDQPEPKGTGEALERARPLLDGNPFLMMYADDLFHSDDIALLAASDYPALLVKEHEHPERFGVCDISDDGFLRELIEKPEHPVGNLVNLGPALLHHTIFDMPKVFDARGEHVIAPQIGILAKHTPVKVFTVRFWHSIGYPEDIEKAEHYMNIPPKERRN